MIRVGNLVRWNAQDLDVEGVTFVKIGGIWLPTECLGNGFAESDEFALRRSPGFFGDAGGVDLLHSGFFSKSRCWHPFRMRSHFCRRTGGLARASLDTPATG